VRFVSAGSEAAQSCRRGAAGTVAGDEGMPLAARPAHRGRSVHAPGEDGDPALVEQPGSAGAGQLAWVGDALQQPPDGLPLPLAGYRNYYAAIAKVRSWAKGALERASLHSNSLQSAAAHPVHHCRRERSVMLAWTL
jgi:hypothetical protein